MRGGSSKHARLIFPADRNPLYRLSNRPQVIEEALSGSALRSIQAPEFESETEGTMSGSGTDKTKTGFDLDGPVVILVEPQLGENIGMAARAMGNFALSRLRIVNPRDGWPNITASARPPAPTISSTVSSCSTPSRRRSPTSICCSPPPRARTTRPSRWSRRRRPRARSTAAYRGRGHGRHPVRPRALGADRTRRSRSPTASSPSRSIRALPRSTWRRRCC